jgi:hypothetical protein
MSTAKLVPHLLASLFVTKQKKKKTVREQKKAGKSEELFAPNGTRQ